MDQPALAMDPRFASRERQPGLDLLRAAAVLLVVVYHAGLYGFVLPYRWHRFGWIGVDLFFVLSGYLIGGQLLAPAAAGRRPDLRRFFQRRALRILPAYLAVLAVYVFIPSWRESPHLSPPWKFLLFVQNIGLQVGTAFSHAWSLSVEGQFYLVLPFVLGLLVRRRHAGIAAAVGVVVAGLVLRGALGIAYPGSGGGVSWAAWQKLIYYATWTRLDPLVLGVGLAAVERFRPRAWERLVRAAPWLWLPGLAAIVYGLSLGEGEVLTVAACVWEFPLVALGMAALLVCAVSERLPFRRVPVPGAAFLASIAYSVYLCHKLILHPMLRFCSAHGVAHDSAAAILLNLAAMLVGGSALFFAVERPFLQLRRRTVPPVRIPASPLPPAQADTPAG